MNMQKIADDREATLDMVRSFAVRLVSLIQLDVGLRLVRSLLLAFGAPPRQVEAILDLFVLRLMDELKESGYFDPTVLSPISSVDGARKLKRLSRQVRRGLKQMKAEASRLQVLQSRRPV